MAIAGIPERGEKLTVVTTDETSNTHTYDIVPYAPPNSSVPSGNVIVECNDDRLLSRFCTLLPEQVWKLGKHFQLEYRTTGQLQTFTSDRIVSVTLT